jgi:predicted Zn-dependent protease
LTFLHPARPAGKLAGRFAGLRTRLARFGVLAVSIAMSLNLSVQPAAAQAISIIRDTEIERVLRGYEQPLLVAAGVDPNTVRLYLVDDPTINAFATQSPADDEAEDIFVNAGLIIQLKTPNQVIGVLAHETGHIAGGDLTKDTRVMNKAMIPMLIGMAVGVAAMALGAGNAGMAAIGLGQQAAMESFLTFSRAQEATADQRGQKYLRATHQSGNGMLEVFEKFAQEDAMSGMYAKDFISDHPADRERIDLLQRLVDSSPYKDVQDTPESVHELKMIQAKLIGYLGHVDGVLARYPASDTSEEARYARGMAYFRKPELAQALAETNSLVKEEPKNPYFWEMLGQIYVDMALPEKGVGPYQKSVDLAPDAPLLRISLAAAQLATDKPALAQPALQNLKVAMQQEGDNEFGWYEAAQAYSALGNQPMADLSTAERYYSGGAMEGAAHFAALAARKLPKGSTEWERANDILAVAGPQAKQRGG